MHSEEKLQEFMKKLNSLDSNIKFTFEYTKERISFLYPEADIVES